ncbi:MAG TPA: polyphosphate kinase 1 [Ruminiclostridium sp.]
MDGLYFNRELSWLKFNERVLEESFDPRNPLFERLKFLSIYSSNLDEFCMVRVGSLFDQIGNEIFENKTNMTPKEQIDAINNEISKFCPLRDKAYFEIMDGFSKNSLTHVQFKSLGKKDKLAVKEYFKHQVLPLLSPQIVDARHPFPSLENKAIYVVSSLNGKKKTFFGIIPLPHNLERIYMIPNKKKFLLLEDIILIYANLLFGIYEVQSKAVIRVTRNADFDIDDDLFEENADYVNYMTDIIKRRGKQAPVRFEISNCKNNEITNFFLSKLNLEKVQCFKLNSPLDLGFVYDLENYFDTDIEKKLVYNPLRPQWPARLKHGNIMKQILHKDVLLSFPFESMQPFVELIREASQDTNVVSIKITLYRIGMQSLIAQYLCDAAENGKEVTVAIELQARFDEQNNIQWSKIMEQAGCKIIYGVQEYKVHSKIMLITRKTDHELKHITHIGTGNYNEKTARLYTDIGILTANNEIGDDAVKFFQNIAIGNIEGEYKHLLVAPTGLKNRIIKLIQEEIVKKKMGKPARIIAKMNSLTDKDVIDSLIAASQAGVKISLIIRGICCLKPSVDNYTDNIEVKSIVGRFLEHSRIYCFGEGEETKVYIASADMMTRNTSRRVEIAAPILDKSIVARLIDMFNIILQDNVKSRLLESDGTYVYFKNSQEKLDSQMYFYEEAYNNSVAKA